MHPLTLINKGKLSQALAALQDLVRNDSANVKLRTFLFQLLTVMGQWNRALNQLNLVGELDGAALPMVQTYREAIQCEALRSEVFSGIRMPLIFGEPPSWLVLLIEALKSDAANAPAIAARARALALEAAPACAGNIDGQPFVWLADADSRIGPVLEVIINGRYFWVPMERISRLELDAPIDLRDVVWTPASFTWTNGAQTVGLIPTRYSATLEYGDESLWLGRRTEWDEHTGNGVGQRMLVTDVGEYPLMDVRVIEFDTPSTVVPAVSQQ